MGMHPMLAQQPVINVNFYGNVHFHADTGFTAMTSSPPTTNQDAAYSTATAAAYKDKTANNDMSGISTSTNNCNGRNNDAHSSNQHDRDWKDRNDGSINVIINKPVRKRMKVALPAAEKQGKFGNQKSLAYSDRGFTSCLSLVNAPIIPDKRLVARSRIWSSSLEMYGPWRLHYIGGHQDTDESKTLVDNNLTFDMNRGGRIKFLPGLITNVAKVQEEMLGVKEYRQYKVRECGKEPRLHALYSSNGNQEGGGKGGYQYGRVTIASQPLQSLTVISKLAAKLAQRFHLPNDEWNIGCHLIIYRDYKDSINWHADDTQGEDLVLSVTVEAPSDPRTICFQPENKASLQTGDEQIELYPIPGDAYSMCGEVQHGYVHAMLKMNRKCNQENEEGRRMAIIFRNGLTKRCDDNGQIVETLAPPVRKMEYKFGSMPELIQEGECYSREYLYNCGGHMNDRGSVAGNRKVGCPSIVVCRMSHNEDSDHFRFLTYVVGESSRPMALFQSYKAGIPIRVFRSSSGNLAKGKYFPNSRDGRVVYRYDGLYFVILAFDHEGEPVDKQCGETKAKIFHLVRGEPIKRMAELCLEFCSFGYCIGFPEEMSVYSDLTSEEVLRSACAFDIDGFHDWYPRSLAV